eukprot:scaffold120958_cov54-Phaeocystis_antarctica.AAC.1
MLWPAGHPGLVFCFDMGPHRKVAEEQRAPVAEEQRAQRILVAPVAARGRVGVVGDVASHTSHGVGHEVGQRADEAAHDAWHLCGSKVAVMQASASWRSGGWLLSAPKHAPGCPKLRPASANLPEGPHRR